MDLVKAKKYLGQHFLKDENIARRISESLSDRVGNVLEIGPGMGVLTKYVLQRNYPNFWVIEIDEESVRYLENHYPELKSHIYFGDFLKLDLSQLFQPILCFSYAQEKWAGDFDTLKVMYRRTPNSNWITLRTYDSYTSGWQRDTIRLAAVTSTYQLAFEAKDNLGKGIVLDDIEVRSVPNCTQPFSLMTGKIAGTSVTLEWEASFDALHYNIKVSNKPLSVKQLLGVDATDAKVFDYKIDGGLYTLEVTGLEPSTEYYFYVQSECVGENSDWSDGCKFRTSDMIILPYYEKFNLDYVENTTSQMENWFAYSSKSKAVPPFVNTHQTKSERLKYSPDSTTALFFQGALNTETSIGKKGYSYICVPEIYIDSVKRLQLSFWTINYVTDGLIPMGDACKIMVGVMNDPSNKKTFVPVDTIEIKSVGDFEEVFVSFENYETPILAPFSPMVKADLKDGFIKGLRVNSSVRPYSLRSANRKNIKFSRRKNV